MQGKGKQEGCKIDLNPQQNKFHIGSITFNSQFDSGNLERVEQKSSDNSKLHTKLFREGMAPVYKSSLNNIWKRIEGQPISNSIVQEDRNIDITFFHKFNCSDEIVNFAFTFPWSYEQSLQFNDQIQEDLKNDPEIYFNRNVLIYSKERRHVELLTITSHKYKTTQLEAQLPNCFPNKGEQRPNIFTKKRCVFISARVHPGETPGSHVLNGILKYLTKKSDLQSEILRDNFVFYIVPMINPDGCYRGHYRTDTMGINLNRYYISPSPEDHPSIFAIKEFVLNLSRTNRLYAYIDLHAHATQKGCFVYGNCVDLRSQVEVCLFPKLLSMISPYFEYEQSNFTEKNMYIKDQGGQGLSREGAGRVALFKSTKINLCYTLECNYNTGSVTNIVADKTQEQLKNQTNYQYQQLQQLNAGKAEDGNALQLDQDIILEPLYLDQKNVADSYVMQSYENVGMGLCEALLEINSLNPMSRLPNTKFKSLQNLKLHLANNLMKIMPHRIDAYVRKMNIALSQRENVMPALKLLYQFIEHNIQIDPLQKNNLNVSIEPVKAKFLQQPKQVLLQKQKLQQSQKVCLLPTINQELQQQNLYNIESKNQNYAFSFLKNNCINNNNKETIQSKNQNEQSPDTNEKTQAKKNDIVFQIWQRNNAFQQKKSLTIRENQQYQQQDQNNSYSQQNERKQMPQSLERQNINTAKPPNTTTPINRRSVAHSLNQRKKGLKCEYVEDNF